MRQRVSEKTVRRYARETGLPVEFALVRGGTDHRIDLCLIDGSIVHWWPKTGEFEVDSQRWVRRDGMPQPVARCPELQWKRLERLEQLIS